jgi:hypothetical protein
MEQVNYEDNKERKKSLDNKTQIENIKMNKKKTQLIKNNSGKELNYQKTVSPKNIEYTECKKFV